MDGDSLVEAWRNQNRLHCLEGDTAVAKLEQLCKLLGYGHGFRWGSPIEHFLSDNSGAIEKLLEHIAEHVDRNQEWREALEAEVGTTCDEDDEDDDDAE